jgi:hypothetical protein
MDDLTDDELLAHAIADVAHDVLDRLADEPHRRSEFLLRFLGLAAAYGGAELAAEALRLAAHQGGHRPADSGRLGVVRIGNRERQRRPTLTYRNGPVAWMATS